MQSSVVGFTVCEVIHKSKAICYRCKDGDRTVIVKKNADRAHVGEQLKNEYNIGRLLCRKTEHVVEYEQIVEDDKIEVAIVMEDGGVNLQSILPSNGFSVRKVLKIAKQCVEGLFAIHKVGIIHCN
jgi:serine/threonine protein kinase